jgi:hypothetical protein
VIDAEEMSRRSPQKQDAPACAPAGAQKTGRTPDKPVTPPGKSSPEFRRQKNEAQRRWRQKGRRKRLASQAAAQAGSQTVRAAGFLTGDSALPAAAQAPKQKTAERAQLRMKTPTVTVCPPILDLEEEERVRWRQNATPAQAGTRHGDYVLNELDKWGLDLILFTSLF